MVFIQEEINALSAGGAILPASKQGQGTPVKALELG
jgi:hypothetical protein